MDAARRRLEDTLGKLDAVLVDLERQGPPAYCLEELLEEIERGLESIHASVDDLCARLGDRALTPTDLGTLVRDAAQHVLDSDQPVVLRLRLPEPGAEVPVDARRLQALLLRLLPHCARLAGTRAELTVAVLDRDGRAEVVVHAESADGHAVPDDRELGIRGAALQLFAEELGGAFSLRRDGETGLEARLSFARSRRA